MATLSDLLRQQQEISRPKLSDLIRQDEDKEEEDRPLSRLWTPREVRQQSPLVSAMPGALPVDWSKYVDDGDRIYRTRPTSEEQSVFSKALDVLQAGNYAAANVVKALLEGDTNLADAAWRGLTLQEKTTFGQILEAYDIPGAPILGFILDIGLDPLTYFNPFIKISSVAKAARGTKWVKHAEDLIRNADPGSVMGYVVNITKTTKDALGRAFVPGYKLPRDYYELEMFTRYAFNERQRKLFMELQEWAEKIPLERRILMGRARENPALRELLTGEEARIFNEISTRLAEFARRGVEEGLWTAEEAQRRMELYLPHIYNARRRRTLGIEITGPRWKPTFAKPRTFETLDEVKAFQKDLSSMLDAETWDDLMSIAHQLDKKWWTAQIKAETVRLKKAQAKRFKKMGMSKEEILEAMEHPTAVEEIVKALKDFRAEHVEQGLMAEMLKWTNGDLGKAKDVVREWIRVYTPVEDIVEAYGHVANEWLQYEARNKFIDEVISRWGTKVPAKIPAVPPAFGLYAPAGKLRFFTVDVLMAKGASKDRAQKIIKRLQEAVLDASGNSIIELPEDLVQEIVSVTRNVPLYVLPREIAQDMNSVHRLMGGDKATGDIIKLYDKLLGNWKMFTTAWRLPFHMRNLMSNTFLMWMAGVNPAKILGLYMDAAKILRGRADDIVRGRSAAEWLEQMRTDGIVPSGFFTADMPRIAEDLHKFLNPKTPKTIRTLLNVPREVGRLIEGASRIGLYLDGLDKGMSNIDAIRRTWKYLFNYDELTPFEQNLKRLIPFYTWMRKNTPLMVEMFFKEPRKFTSVSKGFRAMEQWAEIGAADVQALPEWMHQFGYVKTPLKDTRGQPVWAFIDLPHNDLEKLIELIGGDRLDAFLDYMSQATPLAGIALTLANVRSYPLGGELERWPGERTKAPFWAAWLPGPMQEALGVAPYYDRRTGKQMLGWTKKAEALVYEVFPILRELSNLVPGGGVDLEPEDAVWRRVSFMTGIRFTPVDRQEQMYWKAVDQKNRIADAVRLMLQLGRQLTKEELEAILR